MSDQCCSTRGLKVAGQSVTNRSVLGVIWAYAAFNGNHCPKHTTYTTCLTMCLTMHMPAPPPPHLPPPHLSQPGGGKAHRDSKTDNLLYDHDTGMFVTIDFGLYLLLSGKGFYVAGTPGELGPTPHNELRA